MVSSSFWVNMVFCFSLFLNVSSDCALVLVSSGVVVVEHIENYYILIWNKSYAVCSVCSEFKFFFFLLVLSNVCKIYNEMGMGNDYTTICLHTVFMFLRWILSWISAREHMLNNSCVNKFYFIMHFHQIFFFF